MRELIEIAKDYNATPREFCARVSYNEYRVLLEHWRLRQKEMSGTTIEALNTEHIDL